MVGGIQVFHNQIDGLFLKCNQFVITAYLSDLHVLDIFCRYFDQVHKIDLYLCQLGQKVKLDFT